MQEVVNAKVLTSNLLIYDNKIKTVSGLLRLPTSPGTRIACFKGNSSSFDIPHVKSNGSGIPTSVLRIHNSSEWTSELY